MENKIKMMLELKKYRGSEKYVRGKEITKTGVYQGKASKIKRKSRENP